MYYFYEDFVSSVSVMLPVSFLCLIVKGSMKNAHLNATKIEYRSLKGPDMEVNI